MEFSSFPEKNYCSALHLRTPLIIAITTYILEFQIQILVYPIRTPQ